MAHGRPAKRRRLTPPVVDDNAVSETVNARDLFNRAADWDLEQDYEQKSRNRKTKESNKLPVKTAQGQVLHAESAQDADDSSDSDSFLGSGSEDEAEKQDTPPTDHDEHNKIPLKQRLLQTQEEIARLAALIGEDPEEHAGSFKKLATLADTRSPVSVQKLVLLSQAAIYKDSVPGYRIRAYKDEDLSAKVSKDLRKQRQYEHALITNYQAYVRSLVSLSSKSDGQDDEMKLVALNCASSLLLSIPHFNCRTELLSLVINQLRSRSGGPAFTKAINTIQSFFEADEDGGPSLEAVEIMSKMIKARRYNVREELLNTFFHLRLLTQLSVKSSTTRTDRPGDVSQLHGRRAKKERAEHESKKEKKLRKERKAVEKDMQEANAAVDFEARDKMQSQTLKLVFLTYFRVLKENVPHLTGAVLEGLAKFAHLINQDFFGDILEALKDIIRDSEAAQEEENLMDAEERDRIRESLLATQTAFTLLAQQDTAKSAAALHLDLSFFTQHIYKSLYPIILDADIELGPKSMRLSDPHGGSTKENKVNVSTPVLLLTRALTAILLTPSQPPTTQSVLSFYKRLLTCCLQTPEKSTLAILSLMNRLVDKHGRRLEPLWYSDERKGDGVFQPEAYTVEGTNVLAAGSGVWEMELLRQHYCPQVSEQVKSIDKIVAGLSKQH